MQRPHSFATVSFGGQAGGQADGQQSVRVGASLPPRAHHRGRAVADRCCSSNLRLCCAVLCVCPPAALPALFPTVVPPDITNYETFANLQRWVDKITLEAEKNCSMILVGNKRTAPPQRTRKRARDVAQPRPLWRDAIYGCGAQSCRLLSLCTPSMPSLVPTPPSIHPSIRPPHPTTPRRPPPPVPARCLPVDLVEANPSLRRVALDEAKRYGASVNATVVEASAKSGASVAHTFEQVVAIYFERAEAASRSSSQQAAQSAQGAKAAKIDQSNATTGGKKKCCS